MLLSKQNKQFEAIDLGSGKLLKNVLTMINSYVNNENNPLLQLYLSLYHAKNSTHETIGQFIDIQKSFVIVICYCILWCCCISLY